MTGSSRAVVRASRRRGTTEPSGPIVRSPSRDDPPARSDLPLAVTGRPTLAGGTSGPYDVVVGADGLHSAVRGLAFGPESAYVQDLGASYAVHTVDARPDLDGWSVLFRAPGRTVGLYPTPTDARVTWLYVGAPASGGHPQDVLDAFAGCGWQTPALLDGLRASSDAYFDRIAQVRMDRWSAGRVALVGDAAYCASPLGGNGTSLALAGGYVLAHELTRDPRDPSAAFARYEARMRPFVEGCQGFARGAVGFMLPRSRAHIWAHYQAMRLVARFPSLGRGWGLETSPISLADYA